MNEILLNELRASAQAVYPNSTTLQALVLVQAILESGFNSAKGGSQLARKYNNLFGIKKLKSKPNDFVMLDTWEVIKGKPIQVKEPFATFSSFTECFEQHRTMMNWTRYKPVLESESPEQAFDNIRKCGWATDPSYSRKLLAIYDKYIKALL